MDHYGYVNINMGTQNSKRFSNGNVLPLVAVPYGMATFTLQTDGVNGKWFYSPYSKTFEGIRLTHQPSPWMGDYGDLIICGGHGALAVGEKERWSYFDNRKCVLEPARMRSYVNRDRYTFELSPTNSGAIIRFDFLQESENRINLIGRETFLLERDGDTGLLLGYTTSCTHKPICGELREYFAISLDVPFKIERAEGAISLCIEGQSANMRMATSFISKEQAILNYRRELADKTVEQIYAEARDAWERMLSRIDIEDANEERKRTFYSCLYRVLLWPRRFYERDEMGDAIHLNMRTGASEKGFMYVDNGFWDTFRTLYPLLSVLDTDIYAEMAEGFYNYYRDCGWLPKWLCPDNHSCMPGMLIEAVLSDAIVKDIVSTPLADGILDAMLQDGERVGAREGEGRVGLEAYRQYGYVPYTVAKESVNETLDSCYGDYCIAQAARKLGRTEIAARYDGYAKNYKNLFDPREGFLRAKDENGEFRREKFDSLAWGRDYTEGSAWQNAFAVYHDIKGLDALYNGKLTEKVDEMLAMPAHYSVGGYGFEIHEMSEMADAEFGQCAISNQPSFHIPYIYSELGDVKKTADLVERLCGVFHATEEGYPGDEDNGSMSAWYVLSCLGLYQMCPSRPDFNVSLPLFDKITVRLASGNTLSIDRARLDPSHMKHRIGYTDLMQGGDFAELVKKDKRAL